MSDTAMVPRKSGGDVGGTRPLLDEQLADQLLGKAQAEASSCWARMACCPKVTQAVLEQVLAEELTGHLGYVKHDPAAGPGTAATARREHGADRRRGGGPGGARDRNELQAADCLQGADPPGGIQ